MKNKSAFSFLEGKDFTAFRNYFPNSFAELGVFEFENFFVVRSAQDYNSGPPPPSSAPSGD